MHIKFFIFTFFALKLVAQEGFRFTAENFPEEFPLPTTPLQPVPKQKEVHVETKELCKGAWRFYLLFPKPVEATVRKNCALTVTFNQTVDSKELIKISNHLGFLLKRVSNGVNTLYLVPKRAVFFHTSTHGHCFTVDVIPNDCAPIKETRALKIAKARWLIEERCYKEALCALLKLQQEYPGDKDVLGLLAQVEGLIPRWQYQMHLYGMMQRKWPCDEPLKRVAKWTFFPHSPYVRLDRQMLRTIGLAAQNMYTGEAEQILSADMCHYLYLGQQFREETGAIKGVVDLQGNAVGFQGARSRGKLYVRNEWAEGGELTGTAYASLGGVFGAGLKYKWLFPLIQGTASIEAAYNRPFWDTFETYVHFGREDILRASLEGVQSRYWTWSASLGINRVGIQHVRAGYISLLANAEVFWNVLFPNPILALNYALDAVYVYDRAVRTSATGQDFYPVPLDSFEFHTLRAYLFYDWRDRYHFSVNYGETFNRLGVKSPVYGATIQYKKPCPCGMEWEVTYSKFPSTVVSSAQADYLTATLTFRY